MSPLQWLYAVGMAAALAILLQVLGAGLEKLLKRYTPVSWVIRAARFVAFFVFFFYSVARTLTPVLDQRLPPLVFLFGWLAIAGAALHLISRRYGEGADSPSESAKID